MRTVPKIFSDYDTTLLYHLLMRPSPGDGLQDRIGLKARVAVCQLPR